MAVPGLVPVPDPTLLTTENLRREISGLEEKIKIRLDAMDKASAAFRDDMIRLSTEVDKQFGNLQTLSDEKFRSIQHQFDERKAQAAENFATAKEMMATALESQKALATALDVANKEAITKSESSALKQIDGIKSQLVSMAEALTDKIDGINGRLNRGEGAQSGRSSDQTRNIAIIALLIAGIGVGVAYINAQHTLQQSQAGFSAPAVTVEPRK